MRIDQILREDRILCGDIPRGRREVERALCERLCRNGGQVPAADVVAALEQRARVAPPTIGDGVVVLHARTDKATDLSVGLAIRPDGFEGYDPPDGRPIRFVLLFIIPKKHSDVYLRAMAAILAAIQRPGVDDRLAQAATPAEALRILAQDYESDEPFGEVLALLSDEGTPTAHVAHILERAAPATVADLLDDLNPAERARCLAAVSPARAAEIARLMRLVPLTATIRRMPPERAARVLDILPSSRVADVLQRLRPEEQTAILHHLTQREAEEVRTVLRYLPHTAGGVMAPEILCVGPDATVEEAAKVVAAFPDRRQTDLYVVDESGRLLGWCEMPDLLLADRARRVRELMRPPPRVVEPERDQEELRRIMSRENLHSVPVVARDGRVLGVITQDHLLDVVEQEANEDLHHLVGMKIMDPLHTPVAARVRMRMPWLLLTLGGELLIALTIAKVFAATLEKVVVLAAFMPAIMATGGNVGLQATTMVVRGLGMGTLRRRHTVRVILREMLLGVLLGLGCGAIAAAAAWAINWEHPEVVKIAASVFLAMVSATLATSLMGAAEPLILDRLGMDPAAACGPFVTMFNDLFGSTMYFLIATLMNFSPPAT